jgi:hypothetical protein
MLSSAASAASRAAAAAASAAAKASASAAKAAASASAKAASTAAKSAANAAKSAASTAAKAAKITSKNTISNISKGTSRLSKVIAQNPNTFTGVTLLTAGGAIYGATTFGLAMEQFNKINETDFKIISMTNPDPADITIVEVTYSPKMEIPKGTKFEITGNTNILPTTIINDKMNIDKIINKSKIRLNIPTITSLATYGNFNFHAELEDVVEDVNKDVGNKIISPVKDLWDGMGDMFGTLGKIAISIGAFIVLLFLIFVIRKIIKVFRK